MRGTPHIEATTLDATMTSVAGTSHQSWVAAKLRGSWSGKTSVSARVAVAETRK